MWICVRLRSYSLACWIRAKWESERGGEVRGGEEVITFFEGVVFVVSTTKMPEI